MEKIFNEIYEKNIWGKNSISENGLAILQTESKSGGGSTLKQTNEIRNQLPLILDNLNIQSILDAPCGDFNWMKEIVLKNKYKYIGVDIVKSIIKLNHDNYTNENISFINSNIVIDNLPKCDLILCRDCLVHFSIDDIKKAIDNFKKSQATYLLTTTFTNEDRKNNISMKTGSWQPLNLLITPFNFPKPLIIINEKCTEGGNAYNDKSLALWRLSDL